MTNLGDKELKSPEDGQNKNESNSSASKENVVPDTTRKTMTPNKAVNEILIEFKLAKEEHVRMEGGIEGIKTVIDTMKADVENLKPLVCQVKEWIWKKDSNKEDERDLRRNYSTALKLKRKTS